MHAFKHGKQYPLTYVFLPNKQRCTYERAISDFQVAIKQAIQLTFPNAQFQGCYYHFCQAIMRKTQTLGLQVQYQDDTLGLTSFIRKTAAVVFVAILFIHLHGKALKLMALIYLILTVSSLTLKMSGQLDTFQRLNGMSTTQMAHGPTIIQKVGITDQKESSENHTLTSSNVQRFFKGSKRPLKYLSNSYQQDQNHQEGP